MAHGPSLRGRGPGRGGLTALRMSAPRHQCRRGGTGARGKKPENSATVRGKCTKKAPRPKSISHAASITSAPCPPVFCVRKIQGLVEDLMHAIPCGLFAQHRIKCAMEMQNGQRGRRKCSSNGQIEGIRSRCVANVLFIILSNRSIFFIYYLFILNRGRIAM